MEERKPWNEVDALRLYVQERVGIEKATLREWLAQQTHRLDTVGDVARLVAEDTCMHPDIKNYRLIRRHLANVHQANILTLDNLRKAAYEYAMV